jgi:hypothetical protein
MFRAIEGLNATQDCNRGSVTTHDEILCEPVDVVSGIPVLGAVWRGALCRV